MKFRPEACDSSYCHSLLYQRQQISFSPHSCKAREEDQIRPVLRLSQNLRGANSLHSL
jgi:hypothetical protein